MKIVPMSVEFVDKMGSDLSVVNAARVSFEKESDWLEGKDFFQTERGWMQWLPSVGEAVFVGDEQVRKVLADADRRLIAYLAKHNHWSPFAHTSLQLRIKAPIFVARQLVKHQVGLVWNEVSRRYVDSEPEFYFPETYRKRAANAKQGSSDEVSLYDPHAAIRHSEVCLHEYQARLAWGVCPEQARDCLPLNTMTEWIWTGNVMSFARVCHLRLEAHTQKETRDVAQLINNIAQEHFPVSWAALTGG